MKTKILISIDDQHLSEMPSVIEQLRGAGLDVQRALDSLGTVAGSVESSRIPALREIEGVAAVEPQREFELAPPDSTIQ